MPRIYQHTCTATSRIRKIERKQLTEIGNMELGACVLQKQNLFAFSQFQRNFSKGWVKFFFPPETRYSARIVWPYTKVVSFNGNEVK